MSDFWFENLNDFDMDDVSTESKGIDRFLTQGEHPEDKDFSSKVASAEDGGRVKISSPDDLDGFHRVADSDTLVRMSDQDLWALEEDDDGDYVIERLFDEDGEPVKV